MEIISKKYATNEDINTAVEMMMNCFEFGLNSRSPLSLVAEEAKEVLNDLGLPTRQSLALLVAKRSKLAWGGVIDQTKRKIRG